MNIGLAHLLTPSTVELCATMSVADEDVFAAGRQHAHAVSELKLTEMRVAGTVDGHRASVRMRDAKLVPSCPCTSRHDWCRHSVAVAPRWPSGLSS